nr:MAG TPA: hypothetical protein [Caudoviricetes sp.]
MNYFLKVSDANIQQVLETGKSCREKSTGFYTF